jgi:uncharacterized protein (TIGR02453 family)
MLEKSFSFLRALKTNNNREWFNSHKNLYLDAKQEFESITELLIHEISSFDKDIAGLAAKDCIFRIFRDVRFSHDKSPYKTNFGAYLSKGGKKSYYAGYYFHIEPNESMIAGGIYMPPAPVLKAVRNEIFEHTDEFNEIIEEKDFVKHFGDFSGEKLKTAPKGFPKDFPDIELLKYKNYIVVENKTDKELMNDSLIKELKEGFKRIYRLNQFLNEAIKEVSL